jgi:hypothetical protein
MSWIPQDLLEPPAGQAASLFLISSPLCAQWMKPAERGQRESPAAAWWRRCVLSSPSLLQALVDGQVRLCRELLREGGGGGDLHTALRRHDTRAADLFGATRAYDSSVLTWQGNLPAGTLRLQRGERILDALQEGEGCSGPFWQVRRSLRTTDWSRWPPAVQVDLHRLCREMAAAAAARPTAATTALCVLIRLQVDGVCNVAAVDPSCVCS